MSTRIIILRQLSTRQISYHVPFISAPSVGSMPVMMSFSMSRLFICMARSKIEATFMSVVTLSAIVVTVDAMVAGSLFRTFLITSENTMRWFAARKTSPSPYLSYPCRQRQRSAAS